MRLMLKMLRNQTRRMKGKRTKGVPEGLHILLGRKQFLYKKFDQELESNVVTTTGQCS